MFFINIVVVLFFFLYAGEQNLHEFNENYSLVNPRACGQCPAPSLINVLLY